MLLRKPSERPSHFNLALLTGRDTLANFVQGRVGTILFASEPLADRQKNRGSLGTAIKAVLRLSTSKELVACRPPAPLPP